MVECFILRDKSRHDPFPHRGFSVLFPEKNHIAGNFGRCGRTIGVVEGNRRRVVRIGDSDGIVKVSVEVVYPLYTSSSSINVRTARPAGPVSSQAVPSSEDRFAPPSLPHPDSNKSAAAINSFFIVFSFQFVATKVGYIARTNNKNNYFYLFNK
jgi:hypothetical protein